MKKISNVMKKDWVILILIVLGFALGVYFYPSLPSRVPIHWNSKGQIDGYGSKFFGTFGIPLMNLGMYLLFLVLPYIDPKRKNYEEFPVNLSISKVFINYIFPWTGSDYTFNSYRSCR